MAAVFQNGCYAIRIIMTFDAKSHRIGRFYDLYIKLYVFDTVKSYSLKMDWVDPYLFICIFLQY